jgi:hypothetical protein
MEGFTMPKDLLWFIIIFEIPSASWKRDKKGIMYRRRA